MATSVTSLESGGRPYLVMIFNAARPKTARDSVFDAIEMVAFPAAAARNICRSFKSWIGSGVFPSNSWMDPAKI